MKYNRKWEANVNDVEHQQELAGRENVVDVNGVVHDKHVMFAFNKRQPIALVCEMPIVVFRPLSSSWT